MTKEDARENLKDILTEATISENSVCYVTGDDAETLETAIKALEQTTITELQQHCVEYAKNSCKGCKHYKKHIGCKFRQGKVPREWELL